MDKAKSQILKLFLIAALNITPLLSTSLRPTYLYFVFNLLIIALGAEAGLLHFFSKAPEDKKPSLVVSPKALLVSEASPTNNIITSEYCSPKNPNVVQKSSPDKIVCNVKVDKMKKCPSTPSLFFIGGEETEPEKLVEDDDDDEEVGVLSRQELFTKAETFIGNFYKQLKMQREESWKRIHGLYHKPF